MRQVIVLAALLASVGCYTLQPVAGQPLPLGTVVSLRINDAGRTVLGGQMGPEISEIEGRLLGKDSAQYVLAVQQVKLLRGGEQVWAGERVQVATNHVSEVSEKKFSRGRTAAVTAVAVGVLAIALQQGLLGSITGGENKTPPDTATSVRYPRFGRH